MLLTREDPLALARRATDEYGRIQKRAERTHVVGRIDITSGTSSTASWCLRAGRATAVTASLALVLLTGSLSLPAQARAATLSSDRVGGQLLSSTPAAGSAAPDIAARSGLLMTSDGTELWSRGASARSPMASTTKLMTALVVLEEGDLDDVVTIPKVASGVDYAVGLETGEKRTVRQLLELALVASSNDAANALAVHIGGSPAGFAKRMNDRAGEIGLMNSHFVNAHGLDTKGHYSSPSDLERLMRLDLKHAEFRRIIAMRSVVLPAYKDRKARKLEATDKLLGKVGGLLGAKTGFTDDAKYCLVADAKRGDLELTAVVLGAPNSKARFSTSKSLLEWGFRHYRWQTVVSKGATVAALPLAANPTQQMTVVAGGTRSMPVLDALGPVELTPELAPGLRLPVFAGQRLGVVKLTQGSKVLGTVGAVASRSQASAEETVGVVRVAGYRNRTVTAKAARVNSPVARFDESKPVKRRLTLERSVLAPVEIGDPLGTIVYSQDGRTVSTVPVVAAEGAEAPGPLAQLGALFIVGWQRLFNL